MHTTKEVRYISKDEWPVVCPQNTIWDDHPRIYLPLTQEGVTICPYCGIRYVVRNVNE